MNSYRLGLGEPSPLSQLVAPVWPHLRASARMPAPSGLHMCKGAFSAILSATIAQRYQPRNQAKLNFSSALDLAFVHAFQSESITG